MPADPLLDDALVAALRRREMQAERVINAIRALCIVFVTVTDGLLLWSEGRFRPETAAKLGLVLAGLALYAFLVDRLARGPRYRAGLKYLTIAVDFGLVYSFYLLYRARGFPRGLPPDALPAHFFCWLTLTNLISAFRASRKAVTYSTAVGMTAAVAVGLVARNVTGLLYGAGVVAFSGVIVAFLHRGVMRLFFDLRRKERLLRFLSREVVESVEEGRLKLELGGEKRTVTVLLSDIRGFTGLAEAADPLRLVEFLNEYFTEMTRIVFRHGGVIDKFLGDGVLAVFGAPVGHADDAARAVRAALEMRAALAGLNRSWGGRGFPPVAIGIGLHTGEVVAGNVGAPERMEYTVIGDAVNVASRLEGLNKSHATWILMSEAVRAQVPGDLEVRAVGEAEVRGRKQPVRIFTLAEAGE